VELQENYAAFEALDTEIIAIAQLEKEPERLERIERFVGNSFSIVADPLQKSVGPFNIFGAYLVDKKGSVRVYIPGEKEARPRLDLILAELEEMTGEKAPATELVDGKVRVELDGASSSKPVTQDNVLQVRWMLSHDSVGPGDPLRVAFLPKIAPGWHVYGPRDTTMKPLGIELDLPAGLELESEITYPEPKRKHDDVLDADLTYYEGDIPMPAFRLVGTEALDGEEVTIVARVTFQACDADSCFPPSTLEIPMTLAVSEGGTRRGQVFGWQTW